MSGSPGYSFRGFSSVNFGLPVSAFGELEVVQPTPTAQASFVFGIDPLQVMSLGYLPGAGVSGVNGEAVITCGPAALSYGRMTSRQVTRYRPGQGTMARWTARYSPGVAGNRQVAGLSNQEAGYQVGFVDDVFGILYTRTGTVEIVQLTVTVAPSAPGSVLIVLDGATAVSAPVTVSGSTAVCAYQISQADYSQASGGWAAQATGSVVTFRRNLAGPAASPSTFSANGTGVAAAFSVLTSGVANSEIFIPRSSWNGTTPNGFDPTKGNVYAVAFQYLGFGNASFFIEDSASSQFFLIHSVRNVNTVTAPVLRNPNLYLTFESRNTTNTTAVPLVTASAAAFLEGIPGRATSQFAKTTTKGILAGPETPVLSLRSDIVFKGRCSTAQIGIARISAAADGTKPVSIQLYKASVPVAAQFSSVGPLSAASVDTQATGLSSGVLVFGFVLARTGSASEDLIDLEIFLQAGEDFTITAQSAGASDVSLTVSWTEDI